MHNHVKKVLISEDDLKQKIKELAKLISDDYKGERVTFVGLLSGSIPFLAELIKQVDLDCEIDFMDVSSYRGTQSTGEVKILKDLARPISNRNVIIVEDIVDTGKTLKVVRSILENREPKSLKIVTLLDKPEGRVTEVLVEYVGFKIPNEFVIGFGLDYDELYRNLPYIGVLREEVYM
ncbi:MAG: hypoxanthine phosphoribosyltransferase [Bacilli bacterium]|jgi:hypoxanthine phosphoribosyltransferase|nr:hypoxanthine phosphoribosyltransferase [Bacilli bacterium]